MERPTQRRRVAGGEPAAAEPAAEPAAAALIDQMLPDEMLVLVASFLRIRDLCSAVQVSPRWRRVLLTPRDARRRIRAFFGERFVTTLRVGLADPFIRLGDVRYCEPGILGNRAIFASSTRVLAVDLARGPRGRQNIQKFPFPMMAGRCRGHMVAADRDRVYVAEQRRHHSYSRPPPGIIVAVHADGRPAEMILTADARHFLRGPSPGSVWGAAENAAEIRLFSASGVLRTAELGPDETFVHWCEDAADRQRLAITVAYPVHGPISLLEALLPFALPRPTIHYLAFHSATTGRRVAPLVEIPNTGNTAVAVHGRYVVARRSRHPNPFFYVEPLVVWDLVSGGYGEYQAGWVAFASADGEPPRLIEMQTDLYRTWASLPPPAPSLPPPPPPPPAL